MNRDLCGATIKDPEEDKTDLRAQFETPNIPPYLESPRCAAIHVDTPLHRRGTV